MRTKIHTQFLAAILMSFTSMASATVIDLTIDGSDAIFLAGRTDLTIPPAGVAWPGGLARHPVTPEGIQETLPPIVSVNSGDVIRALDPAVGGISFFNGFGGTIYGPSGGPSSTDLNSFGGISGFKSDGSGPLAGVFLDNSIPNGSAPARLDFSGTGIGTDFLSLSPDLGQVFYIGDGMTSGGIFQEFIAPAGATRLALGVPDGFAFFGPPGAYDDNDGAYRIRLGINEIPTVPEPAILTLMGIGLAGIGWKKRKSR